MTRFLKWIDDNGAGGTVTEAGAAEALETYRSRGENWRGPSFPSISGAGSNGAIVHYRVTPESQRPLQTSPPDLIDAGAQALDGTTDLPRTVPVGLGSAALRELVCTLVYISVVEVHTKKKIS